ncbi:MAG: SH3 domain-containing protein [Gemmatimonadales bacterium]
MTYIECPECGQRALDVATRCPRCGHAYPSHFLPRPAPRLHQLRPLLALGGVAGVLALVVLVVVALNRAGPEAVTAPPVAAPPPPDTAPSAPSLPASKPLAPAGDSSPPIAPPPSSVAPAVGEQVRRYARTWINVRGGRSAGAPALRVLNPGDAVLVDSLERGWYRVLVDGRTLGYAHRANLGAAPPPAPP